VLGDNLSTTGITVTAGTENLIGPIPFTAPTTGIGDGHKCILAAIEADGEGPITGTASTDAPNSNQIAQRNLQFVGTCEHPLTNATTSSGSVQLTLTVTPDTGTPPSLTALPDVGVTFDDADSTWFNAWSSQAAGEAQPTFQVTHDATANTTTVRLGTFSIVLNPVTLAAGASRNATGNFNLASGGASADNGSVDRGGAYRHGDRHERRFVRLDASSDHCAAPVREWSEGDGQASS
jgi:hypothetical protein